MTSRHRTLAYAGILAAGLTACAGTQTATRPTVPEPAGREAQRRDETPQQRCQRERRSRVQECIIEAIATSCRERNQGNEDGFYSCVSENLPTAVSGPARQVSVTVSQGDEVLSMRSGGPVVMDVVALEAASISQTGIQLTFRIERLATAQPEQRTQVDQSSITLNYDGTSSGDAFKLRVIPIWNLRAQAASGGAQVSFETSDPRVTTRPSEAGPSKK